jgi:hypothetical protein
VSPEPVGSETVAPDVVERPVLRVVRGTPDAVELAALVAVVSAAGGDDAPPPHVARAAWASPSRSVRAPLPSGGWRASVAPR